MKIAVNTRFLLDDYLEGYGYFVLETLRRLSEKYPEHEFIFIFDRPVNKKIILRENVRSIVVGPPARHPLLWKLWYDIKIPAVLKKHKADVFVSCDGFCSLATKVPQCMVVHDLSFLHFPSFNKKSHVLFYKRYIPKYLKKAATIATVSAFSKKDILMHYTTIDDSKIDIVYSAAKEIFNPVSEAKKEAMKKKFTGGKEYFVYAGAIHPRKNLMNLLKAFSIFKKKQQSNMKLLLAGRLAWKYDSFIESLKTYKYRDDIVMTGYLDENEMVKIVGSAYALVYPSLWEGFGVPVLEAMRCHVPVITSADSPMQEIAKDAALYVNPSDYNDIAEKMMLLYKDESLRKKMIQNGKEISRQYSWDKTADLLWKCMMKAIR